MSTQADRRDTRRIVVGPEFAISFTLKGHGYRDVRITNLSPGGCFAMVGARDARLFERGAVLEGLTLLHPELPKAPIMATVSYVLGGRPGHDPMEMVGVGIQFLGMADAAHEALDTWIEAALASQQG
ncbi:MAG: hypothetical protein H6P99_1786 [Holophagaceae bacterium]|jgi:hypothetical protein|nr:hypothetical protein [Holophagaceae bacterium]HLP30396.1 PilZ domain-containing protein [Geothrix sp.]